MKRKFSYKAVLLSLLALLICLSAVVLSVAYLKQQTGAVTNTFVRGEDPTLTYRLVYDLNGGTSDTIKSEAVEATEEEHTFTVTREEPSRLGYQFLGWADTADAKAPTYSGGSTITVTKDDRGKTLYAVWQEVDDFVLYFQSNLPDSVKNVKLRNMPETMTAKYAGSSQHTFTVTNVPYDENADATGLTFLGWTTVEGGTVIYPTDDTIDVTVTQKTTVLYAVWGYEYFVKFDRNPGEGTVGKHNRADGALVNEDPADQILLSSDSKTVSPYLLYESGEYSYVRTGYLLVGFSSEADGATPEEYVTVAKPGRNNAKTVYAIWAQGNYALIYDANGGSNAPATQTATAGELSYTFTISTKIPDRMEGSNGVFKGWAYTADAETPDFMWNGSAFIPASVKLKIDKPVRVLYAVWEYTYTLTYQRGLADADSPMPENLTVTSSKPTYTFTVSDKPTPFRDAEYQFHYWSYGAVRTENEIRYCNQVANYFAELTLTANNPSAELYPRFRPTDSYKLVLKGLKDEKGNEDTTLRLLETTQTFGLIPIPSYAVYEPYAHTTFLGWSETDDPDNIEPDYVIGDVVRINPDTDTHTKILYPVYREWDYFTIFIDYNEGYAAYKKNSCDDNYTYVYSYESSVKCGYIKYGETSTIVPEFTARGVYMPHRPGYTFKGFNYRKNGTEASFNSENNPSEGWFSEGQTDITMENIVFDLNKADTGEQVIEHVETGSHGSRHYRLKLYAVWALNDAYDVYTLRLDGNGATDGLSDTTFQKQILQADPAYEVTFSTTTANVTRSYTGYKLTGFAYDKEGNEPCATYVDGHLDKDITVSQSDTAHVQRTAGGGKDSGDAYRLTLYATWEMQQVFGLTLDYNGGSRIVSNRTEYSSTSLVTRPPEETSNSRNVYYSSSTVPVREGYVFKGYAYAPDATEPDYPWLSSGYVDTITIDHDDKLHTESGTVNGAPSTSMKLYAVWEAQQYFRILADFNGGRYLDSQVYYYSGTKEKIMPPDVDFYEHQGGFSFTSRSLYPSRQGYELLGYAYSKDAVAPDFSWSSSSHHLTPNIVVNRLDDDPTHEITHTTTEDGIPVTELKVYAVWQKQKQFKLNLRANGGKGDIPTTWSVAPTVTTVTKTAGTALTAPKREGYQLLGYATAADASEPDYPVYYEDGKVYLAKDITFSDTQDGVVHDTESAPETHTLTLYAVWKPMRRFIVAINEVVPGIGENTARTEGGLCEKTVTSVDVTVNKNNNSTLSSAIYSSSKNYLGLAYDKKAKVPDFVGESFTFKVDMADTEHVSHKVNDDGTETVTLQLYVIMSLELRYAGRGENYPEPTTVINPFDDERITPIVEAMPTYQNFLFIGWSTEKDSVKPVYGAENFYTKVSTDGDLTPTYNLYSNTTLYSVWAQAFSISYRANGGVENSTPPYDIAYIAYTGNVLEHAFAVGAAIPTHPDGLTFLGWSTDPNATAATYQPSGTILVNGNTDGSETVTTLYAVWQEDTGETTADETTETDGPLLNGSGSPTSPSEKLE